jgi:hypothetical protein
MDVAIVSEDVAARTWPSEDPIGKRMRMGGPDSDDPWRTIVGVAAPTRYRELARSRPTLYLPAAQFIVVRSRSCCALARRRIWLPRSLATP